MEKTVSTLLPSSLLAASIAIASSAFTPASAASLTFDVSNFTGKDAQARITLEEVGDDIEFTVDVVDPIADIRGVFFNIANDSLLSGLSVSGSDVTDFQFGSPESVKNLGNGANIRPRSFDAGVEIGTQGIGRDDIQSTLFTLSHNSVALTLEQFFNQDFGVRLTSVGEKRKGSSKLAGTAPGSPSTSVPEPGTAAALGLFALGALRVKKNKKDALHS